MNSMLVDPADVPYPRLAQWLLPLGAVICLLPMISSASALLLGVVLAVALGNPYVTQAKNWTHRLLSLSVIGLGAGMNLFVVAKVGFQGIGYTVLSIATAFAVGTWLGRVLKTEFNTSFLITAGTAICGGSAIAALAPVLRAKHHEVSVALGIVFMLNACALFIFPPIGHQLSLSQSQFGLWCALAIHDTSSVVGAAMQYGAEALRIGTTVKLARALWIVPLTLLVGMWVARKNTDSLSPAAKTKYPWFILGFIMMAAAVTWFPSLQPAGHFVEAGAKRLLVLTLFLIGSGLTKKNLRMVGIGPFLQGVALWGFMAASTLLAVMWMPGLGQ